MFLYKGSLKKRGESVMKILLIDPPFQRLIGFYRFYFPLGLTYLAAVLKQAGHEVLIYDAEHDISCISPAMKDAASSHHLYLEGLDDDNHPVWQELQRVLEEFKPQAVGVSVLTPKLATAAKTIRLIKKHNSRIIVFAGGEHVTVRPQDIIKEGADYVVCGEGECGTVQLIEQLEGVGCPSKIIRSPLIENLDTLPLPALECLPNIQSYRPIDLGLMMDARGCPFGCNFCSLRTIWGRRVRYHSIDRTVREIALRQEHYGTKYISFRNGTFTFDRSRVVALCYRMLDERIDVEWECLTRADTTDAELLQLMQTAGCRTVRVGIESGSEKILQYMNKGVTLSQIRAAAKVLNQSGLFWAAYFMLGVPVETEETIRETLDLIAEINPPFVTLARFSPLPGTLMYQEVVDAGMLDEDTTDWTWAANQSLGKAFVRYMSQERFLDLMQGAAQFVKEHNSRQAEIRSDPRLK